MKKIKQAFGVLFSFFLLVTLPATVLSYSETDPVEATLFAGQNIEAGTVYIWNDEANLYVKYETTNDWSISQTHLEVAESLEEIPQTKSGNPKIGHFTYSDSYDPTVTQVLYTIDITGYDWGTELFIAAHTVLEKEIDGSIVQSETGWADGIGFPGRNWATYLTYVLEEPVIPPEEINPGDFRTQTQGGWGSTANGNNPGTYRDQNFDLAFPSGLTIGNLGGNTITLTSSQAVEDFLPQGSVPAPLLNSYINPLSTEAGVLAGQLTALTLSIGFDLYDEDFGASALNLKDLIVDDASSPFYGFSVEEVIDEANIVLSGLPSPYSPSQVNEAVSRINENFVDGTYVGDYLRLP